MKNVFVTITHYFIRHFPTRTACARLTALAAVVFSVSSPIAAQQTVWSDSTIPAHQVAGDTGAVELGVRFSVGTTGTIDAVRFYRGEQGNGLYQVNLWGIDGTLLGSGNVYEGLQSPVPGWQQIPLATPIAVQAGTEYVVSYFHLGGAYAYDMPFFEQPLSSGHILMPINAGVYQYGETSSYPKQTWSSVNYWVAPVFVPIPRSPTTIVSAPGIMTLDTVSSSAVNLRFHPGGIGFGEVNRPVSHHLFYVDGQYVGMRPFVSNGTPTRLAVTPGGSHSFVILGQSEDGSLSPPSQESTAQFPASRTLADGPFGMFAPHVGPNYENADNSPNELGQGFRSAVSGEVRGIRFYKGSTSTGPFTGSLWTAGGQLIATTESVPHTGFGYHDLMFSQPVQIQAEQEYVVSYFSPNGRYAYSPSYFAPGAIDFYPLTTTTGGLRHVDSPGFPDRPDATLSNFFVDVIFDVPYGQRETLFSSDSVPSNPVAFSDVAGVELGVAVVPSVDGLIEAVRVYRGLSDADGYRVSVWSADGTVLARVHKPDNGQLGWIEVAIPAVSVQAGTTYVISYFAAHGGYAYNHGFFDLPLIGDNLLVESGSNGRYRYGGGFPKLSNRNSNYWVDVVFRPANSSNISANQ